MKNRLRILRAESDWSQGELFQRLRVSRQAINVNETEKHDPSLELAFRMAQHRVTGNRLAKTLEGDGATIPATIGEVRTFRLQAVTREFDHFTAPPEVGGVHPAASGCSKNRGPRHNKAQRKDHFMNSLRQNLSHALLSLAFLATITTVPHPDRQIAAHRQIMRLSSLVASAASSFDSVVCMRSRMHRINPGVALKLVVRELLQRNDS